MCFWIMPKLSWHNKSPNIALQVRLSACLPYRPTPPPYHLWPLSYSSILLPQLSFLSWTGDQSSAQTGGTGPCLEPLRFFNVCASVPLHLWGFSLCLHLPLWIKEYFSTWKYDLKTLQASAFLQWVIDIYKPFSFPSCIYNVSICPLLFCIFRCPVVEETLSIDFFAFLKQNTLISGIKSWSF